MEIGAHLVMSDGSTIKSDDVFLHVQSSNVIVVTAVGSMKAEGGEWIDAVSYKNTQGKNPDRIFTRDAIAFRNLFVRGAGH